MLIGGDAGPFHPAAVHWDGTSWKQISVTSPGSPSDTALSGITDVPGQATLWAVGGGGSYPQIWRRG